MNQTLNLQANYSANENGYQLWIPLDCSIQIPKDDPVRKQCIIDGISLAEIIVHPDTELLGQD